MAEAIRIGGWRSIGAGLLLVLALACGAPGVQAAPSRAELAQEVETLRAELADLRRSLEALKQKTELPDSASALLADVVARMGRLERQIAQLNGRLEEQDHALAQMRSRLDRLAADVQGRLLALESGAPSAGNEAASAGAQGAGEAAGPGRPEAEGAGEEETAGTPAAARDSAASSVQAAPALPDDPDEAYDAAFMLLRKGDFAGAEKAFAAFLKKFPHHALAANAQYWLGETFYVRKDYARAAEAFLKGYQNYRDQPKAADSLLKLAMSLSGLGNNEEACAALAELAARYPNASTAVRQRAAVERRRLECR